MYEGNIDIDKPRRRWTKNMVEGLFIFCQLDRVMSYESVCKVYRTLDNIGLTQFHNLLKIPLENLKEIIEIAGHRFPKQTAEFIKFNVRRFDGDTLRHMSRDEIVEKCKGFGYKLASMFHSRIHKTNYAIIDVHVDRFLKQHGCKATKYKDKESYLQKIADDLEISMEELDWQIWNTNRIGNR